MASPRIYYPAPLAEQTSISLHSQAVTHVSRVLRLRLNDSVILFNGDDFDYRATISQIDKRNVIVDIIDKKKCHRDSPLHLHLGQVISRGERMRYTLQKAVELGVSAITPLTSQRCNVKFDAERAEQRMAHWQGIIISACEQCGRNRIPDLHPIMSLADWAKKQKQGILLQPNAADSMNELPEQLRELSILVGPEGGFTDDEVFQTIDLNFKAVRLGPRILRTETAAIAMIAVLQSRYGDYT